jgi:hypothetical protein
MRKATHGVDARQMALDFLAEVPAPSVELKRGSSLVEIPGPSVIHGDAPSPPAKVLNVFEMYFDKVAPQTEAQTLPELQDEVELMPWQKFSHIYPDHEQNCFTWTDADIVRLHEALLDQLQQLFTKKSEISSDAKMELLQWVYEYPPVFRYREKYVQGVLTRYAVMTHEIPFTFYACCRYTGAEPDVIQSAIEARLRKDGDIDLLDRI